LDKIDLIFLNSGNSLTITNFNVTLKEKIKEEVLTENSQEKRNSLTKIYSFIFSKKENDDKSIKKLENNIIETFTFLKNNNLIPILCPTKINFKFLRDTFIEQEQHKKFQKDESFKKKIQAEIKALKDINTPESLEKLKKLTLVYTDYADSKFQESKLNNESIINISTEHVKLFSNINENLNGKFLNSLRNNFSNIPFNICTNNSNKIITELVILHELGHFVSAEKLRGTLIARSHRDISEETNFPIIKKTINTKDGKKEIEINHMKNISRNILEGFSDSFSVYLTHQHYPNEDIINKYSQSRKETSTDSMDTIKHYDLNNIFKEIEKLPKKHIDLLIDDFFNISINNSINITKKLIKDNPTFEQELKSQFEYYSKDLNIQLNQNKSLIENIEEQLKKSCISNFKLTNTSQINFNILQIRNNSSVTNLAKDNIKP